MPRVLQIFSVPLNVFVLVNGKYKARSNITIRYNNRLRYLGTYIPVNRNPQIKNVRLYKVRGDRKKFDFAANSPEIVAYYDLQGLDSIPYESGFSYFLEVFRENGRFGVAQGRREHYTCEWFMQDNSYRVRSGFEIERIWHFLQL